MTTESQHEPGAPNTISTRTLRATLVDLVASDQGVDASASGSLEVVGIGYRGATTPLPNRAPSATASPEHAVLGLQLASEFGAIAIVAPSVVATSSTHRYRDGALALAVNRAGESASLLTTTTGITDTSEPHGWLVDAALRTMELPTAPEPAPTLLYPIVVWLDRIMISILHTPATQPVSWSTVSNLCPVPPRWRSTDPVDLGATLGSTTRSWEQLHAAARAGTTRAAGVSPEIAAWMDTPMFARWCLGSYPDPASLRGDVEFLAPPEIAENIDTTLRSAWAHFV